MARRGKTVIGEKNLEQSRTMMQAEESGQSARQRAHEGLMNERARGRQEMMQGASQLAGQFQHNQDRDLRQKIATGREAIQTRGQELQEARAGYERTPGGQSTPLLDERRQRLEAEMGKGTAQDGMAPGATMEQPETSQRSPEEVARLQQQGEQPIEMGQSGAAAPGVQEPGSLRMSEAGKRAQTRADYEAETRRMHAQTRMMELQSKAMKAQFSGDKEALKPIRAELGAQLEKQQDLFTRMMNQTTRPNDFSTLKKWADKRGGLKGMQDGGQLQKIIEDGMKTGMGPQDQVGRQRLQGFIQAYMDHQSMEYAMTLGEIPGEYIDWDGDMVEKFRASAKQISTIMKRRGPIFQEYSGIQSLADKRRYLTRVAAGMALAGVSGGATAAQPETPQFDESMPPGAGMQEMDLPMSEHRGDFTVEQGPGGLPGDANYTEQGFQKYEHQQGR